MIHLLRLSRKWFVALRLNLYPRIRPLVGANKRNSRVRYAVRNGLCCAIDPALDEPFFFNSPKRARLYFRPDGVLGRIRQVGAKYQDKAVVIKGGDSVLDVGANVGEFSYYCSLLGARALAVEPDPSAYSALRNNSGSARFTPLQAGLSHSSGLLKFYLSPNEADSSFIEPESYCGTVDVSVTTIDEVASSSPARGFDFIKVEAEGYEPEVLAGGMATLSICNKVAVDVSPERRGESTWTAVKEILEGLGFSVWQRGGVAFGFRAIVD